MAVQVLQLYNGFCHVSRHLLCGALIEFYQSCGLHDAHRNVGVMSRQDRAAAL
jgi:hypothetical protein